MKRQFEQILALADIKIDGTRKWDVKVNNPGLYQRILAKGSLGAGEAYMDGWWDCASLDEMIYRLWRSKLDKNPLVKKQFFRSLFWNMVKAKLFNLQTIRRAKIVGKQHYDIGNDLYGLMLDKRMCYSCGYWKNAKTLDQAQEAKLDLICKKLMLRKGMTVLDIGCGWGSFAEFAARKYKVKVIGVTISKEQAKLARERCKGLSVEIRLQDYRNITERFDRIISIGMFEHVGVKNYKTFMKVCHKLLNDKGLMLLHTIGRNFSGNTVEPWIGKYIFPNSMLPSVKQIATAAEDLFVLEDWHSFGQDYDKTLMAWHKNFTKNWNKLKQRYSARFYRMWTYYLLTCAGTFRSRNIQLWQVVFSKNGVEGGYMRIS